MKIITSLTLVLLFVVLSVPVLAENSATNSTKAKELKNIKVEKVEKIELRNGKVEETIENKIEKLEPKRKQNVIKVRNSVEVRYKVYEKIIERSGNLLTKLQEKIDRAQKAGINTKVIDGYMTDAKAKLADAQTNLNSIKDLKDSAIDKTTFLDIQKKFQLIHKDLNAIRLDGAKVISELKRYNAENEKLTPKPTRTKSATASASEDK
ncbi:MAG: hypothetical protein Q7R97_01540 [Candidatus Daviesbacteria bacterium]|nr:hypothetical protein [Candidatus Daviesbacteria bacterium]